LTWAGENDAWLNNSKYCGVLKGLIFSVRVKALEETFQSFWRSFHLHNKFFWTKLVRNGQIRAVQFRPKNIRAKFCWFWRISPKSANFWQDIWRNSPKSKKNRPQILRQNSTAGIRLFSDEQEFTV
jgi:hypothetical protein